MNLAESGEAYQRNTAKGSREFGTVMTVSFGQRARELIDQLRGAGTRRVISLEQVAKGAGLSKRTLEKWKSGDTPNPPKDNVLQALEYLGLDKETAIAEINRILAQVKASEALGESTGAPAHVPFNTTPVSRRQPTLSDPPDSQRSSHYARRVLRVRGRDAQESRLRHFLKVKDTFAWLQLAGEAGQGKSRLAYDVMCSMREKGWHAGFLNEDDLAEFCGEWREWQPDLPTLLIVDYVVGRDQSVGPVFRQLARRAATFRQPVRMLLLERQRWDHGGSLNLDRDGERLRGASRAAWFVALTERYDGADSVLSQTRFEDGVIELTRLEVSNLVGIVRDIAKIENKKVDLDNALIEQELARIDSSGRPLYAYFLGHALARDPDRRYWNREDLLDDVLRKDWFQRWRAAFDGTPPEIGEDHVASQLAVIATMIGGIDFVRSRSLGSPFNSGPKVRRLALTMTDGFASVGVAVNILPPLQPDILGEWFVLRSINGGLSLKSVCNSAWRAAPTAMARFIERLVQDFPDQIATAEILDYAPGDDAAVSAYASVSASIIFHLHNAGVGFSSTLITMLKHSAGAGDGLAMTNLGACYQNGHGLCKDPEEAVTWYRKGAEAGNGGAMTNLGCCYEYGIGVGKDPKEAVTWYRKGAEAGNGRAMTDLGWCYENGIGVGKDPKEAVTWYRKGAEAGNGVAMTNLGACYQNGHGVGKDPEEAVTWYRKGAEAGNGRAMTDLGWCYENGIGVGKDTEEAVTWYRKGAEAGNGVAMTNLGWCYKNGIGVGKDPEEAVTWYRKGAEAGNGRAMNNLGACYEDGIGVGKDPEEAVTWYRKGAEAGDDLAMTNLGLCYEDGIGVGKNPMKAVTWYSKGAKAGNRIAMANLGWCYKIGFGVGIDLKEAERWFHKCAS